MPPRRPFYRRKRSLAAGLLWLAAWYPLSLGPAIYAERTGRLAAPWNRVFHPALALRHAPPVGRGYVAYLFRWHDLAPEPGLGSMDYSVDIPAAASE